MLKNPKTIKAILIISDLQKTKTAGNILKMMFPAVKMILNNC